MVQEMRRYTPSGRDIPTNDKKGWTVQTMRRLAHRNKEDSPDRQWEQRSSAYGPRKDHICEERKKERILFILFTL